MGLTKQENECLPPPPFTIKQLKEAIPEHCFQRSFATSSLYLLVNLLICGTLWYLATYIDHMPAILTLILWPAYWIAQGVFFTGIWVIGHECGHQAYCESRQVNNLIGWVLHSALLVPFHSWRISHGKHHKATGHMTRDQVFVPTTRSKLGALHEAAADSPLLNAALIIFALTLGWPAYLIFNVSSQNYKKRANHFEPNSPIFKPVQKPLIVWSDIGLAITIAVLYLASIQYSFATVVKYYGIPYLFTNLWLVLITYLQHTHREIPHYRGDEWSFIRGALATVDRDFRILNAPFHHICDTHVAHHLFSTMPHYHAQEATESLKKVLGKYYFFDDTPILESLWREWQTCQFVEDEGDVVFYKNLKDERKKKN